MAAPIPSLTYLTFDAVTRGVGASQVLPYVSRLEARGVSVELHEFEPRVPGAAGGAGRMLRGALAVRGAELVHARAHLAGAAAVLGRPRRWLWDVRSLWIDERIEAGMLRRRGLEERVLRRLERKAAGSCDAVVMLSAAAVPVLSERTGVDVGSKSHVIPTCVDLSRFGMSPLPPADPVRLLLSGSLNSLYDVPTMIRFATRMGAVLERVGGAGSPWEDALASAGVHREELPFAEMPARLARSHVGLCVQRPWAASSVAAAPIKAAEFLACGRPVVVSAGLGDLPDLVSRARCGVVVDDTTDAGLDRAAAALGTLLEDPALPARCRGVAEDHFDIDQAVDQLVEIYAAIASA